MIETHPQITVVTVTFNAAAVLEKTMLSVINQTYAPVEYIVIDGCSTDGSVEIIKKYEDRLSYWISEPDRGMYDAMNKGIDKASGEWICFLNSGDTFVDNQSVEKIASELQSSDIQSLDIIYGNILIENADGSYREKIAKEPCNIHRMYFCHQAAFTKTSLLKIYNFDETYKLSADLKFFKQCYYARKHFLHASFPVSVYDMNGLSNINRQAGLLDNIKVIKAIDKGWSKYRFIFKLQCVIWWQKLTGNVRSILMILPPETMRKSFEVGTKINADAKQNRIHTHKKILQIFASRFWGGGEQYVYDLSQRLIQEGNEVIFLSKKSDIIEKRIAPCGKLYTLSLKGMLDLRSAIGLYHIVKKNNIELVHIHQFKDTYVAMFAKLILKGKLKIILTRHLIKKAKTNYFYTLMYRSIDKIIFVSELAKNTFLSTRPSIRKEKIAVVHNSFLPKKSENSEVCNYRDKFNIPKNDIVISFMGNLNKQKGLAVLLQALADTRNKNITLLAAGIASDAEYERYLKQLVLSLHIEKKVIFLGFVDNTTELVQQIDIGTVPSVLQEAFGLVALEYMQAGKPVISTNNGAQKEFIQHNTTGILIPPNDSYALAKEIDRLIDNKQEREQIGRNGQQYFDANLNYDRFFKNITHIYE
ncbi:hypothetical protein FACS1894199_10170 [Bacteroidia bacterium]|nr:hypothetical protein FACS1894199_10170 [Bacteroidia bacterium]